MFVGAECLCACVYTHVCPHARVDVLTSEGERVMAEKSSTVVERTPTGLETGILVLNMPLTSYVPQGGTTVVFSVSSFAVLASFRMACVSLRRIRHEDGLPDCTF